MTDYLTQLQAQKLLLAFAVFATLQLGADDVLEQFQQVTTCEYADEELGFSLAHPYEWQPSTNPIGESDFYVGAPFAMPSFWVNVQGEVESSELEKVHLAMVHARLALLLESASDSATTQHVADANRETKPEDVQVHKQVPMSPTEQRFESTIRWVTPDAGRHYISTTLVSVFTQNRWSILTVNQFDRETQWTSRLQAIVDSFAVLTNP